MRISIRLKLLLSFLLLIIIMSTTFATFLYARERETVRVEMIKRGNAVIRTFTRLVIDNVLVMDYITILDNSQALVAGSDVHSISLLNVEGDVLVSTAGPRARRIEKDEFFESVISAQRESHRETVRDEQRFLEFISPVVPLGETIYLVRMEIAWAAAEARLAEVTRGVMALTGARVLDRVDRNIKRCERIIDELLDYTRVGDLSREPTRIDEWLNEVLDEQSIPAEISVARELHAGIEIPIDRERLRRCMVNLIGNASDAMTQGKAEGEEKDDRPDDSTLTVGSRVVDDRVSISVTDCGPGMSRDVLEKIFEPMFSTKSFGIGLGLTVVRHVMEKHGGSIEIESEERVGTCVRLWLAREAA